MKGITKPEVEQLTAEILSAEPEHIAYEVSATEQFYFIHKCLRVIMYYTEQGNGEKQS